MTKTASQAAIGMIHRRVPLRMPSRKNEADALTHQSNLHDKRLASLPFEIAPGNKLLAHTDDRFGPDAVRGKFRGGTEFAVKFQEVAMHCHSPDRLIP